MAITPIKLCNLKEVSKFKAFEASNNLTSALLEQYNIPLYDSSNRYSVGDFCYRIDENDGTMKIYRCIHEGATGDPFNPDHWESYSIIDDLDKLHDLLESLQSDTIAKIQEKLDKTVSNTDIIPISRGGTGATTAEQALKNLGLNVSIDELNILKGIDGFMTVSDVDILVIETLFDEYNSKSNYVVGDKCYTLNNNTYNIYCCIAVNETTGYATTGSMASGEWEGYTLR